MNRWLVVFGLVVSAMTNCFCAYILLGATVTAVTPTGHVFLVGLLALNALILLAMVPIIISDASFSRSRKQAGIATG